MHLPEHNAVVFEGDRAECLLLAKDYITTTLTCTIEGNPDYEMYSLERFTIEDARTLKERAGKSAFGSKQIFVIASHVFLNEAQNALLKIFEEPDIDTYFIIIVPTVEQLLPTVRSRLLYGGRVKGLSLHEDLADAFLNATIAERLRLLEPIIKNKERTTAKELLETLERKYRAGGVGANIRELKEITFVSQYITDKSSSPKMLLEHLAVTL